MNIVCCAVFSVRSQWSFPNHSFKINALTYFICNIMSGWAESRPEEFLLHVLGAIWLGHQDEHINIPLPCIPPCNSLLFSAYQKSIRCSLGLLLCISFSFDRVSVRSPGVNSLTNAVWPVFFSLHQLAGVRTYQDGKVPGCVLSVEAASLYVLLGPSLYLEEGLTDSTEALPHLSIAQVIRKWKRCTGYVGGWLSLKHISHRSLLMSRL